RSFGKIAVEVMGFGTDPAGIKAFTSSPSLLGDLGSSYVGHWVGNVITLGTAISAFGCCLACVAGAARLLYALARDTAGPRGLGQSSTRWGTPVWATLVVVVAAGVIVIVEAGVAAHADAFNSAHHPDAERRQRQTRIPARRSDVMV